MTQDFLGLFSKIYKGDEGELEVLKSISKLLNTNSHEDNYYLIPKSTIKDINGSREIDLLLLHPVLGLYAIEVKNWSSLDFMNSQNNPYNQANQYQDILLALLQREFGKVPINIEYRVVFPSISKKDAEIFYEKNPYYKSYENHTFFQEHLEDKDIFSRFFNASNAVLPNKKEFLKISSMLVPTDKLKSNQEKIIPIITKDEILFFDQKQLSILNGYSGGFRIIRGVAGTGKTIILTNFVNNRLQEDSSEKFLILCYNKNLVNSIKGSFGEKFSKRNIAVYSIMHLLEQIGFDYERAKIDRKQNISAIYKAFESESALDEFQEKFSKHLASHPIDYFLCDETQDMPAGFMRIVYEEIGDCIFFIDEAQRFYDYTMHTIGDVFHHPRFEKLSMRGRVKNLKNVYRTPSNISQTAFKILSFDKSLNDYYKKSFYLKKGFLNDVNFVLEDGNIIIGEYDEFTKLQELLSTFKKDETTVVLSYTKKSVEVINNIIESMGAKEHISAITMQSVKGLEAQNIIIHNFSYMIQNSVKYKNEMLYRQLYVLLTRAQESLYLSLGNVEALLENEATAKIYNILKESTHKHEEVVLEEKVASSQSAEEYKSIKRKLAKIQPILSDVKKSSEFVVTASELFAVIGGLFSL